MTELQITTEYLLIFELRLGTYLYNKINKAKQIKPYNQNE